MFDFPNSPSGGQVATNGVVSYTWDGSKWAPTPAGAAAGVSSFNTRTGAVTLSSGDVTTVLPPSSTTPVMDGTATIGVGTTWARADHVHPTDTSRASVASVTAGAAAAAANVGRNFIHNGLFNVVQRGAGPFTTAAGYTADRWYQSNAGNTVSTTIAALTDPNRAAIGDESALVGFRPVVTGVAGAANQTHITQPIEGVRRLSGKTVTVSFWAWASASLNLGVSWDQYFGTGGSPSAQVFGTGQVIAITTTPTRYSATFNLPSASGKTIGTNGDDLTELVFAFSTGSTNAAWLGNVGVQSGTFTLWGVQLEIGSVATPLDYGGSPQQQLAACQRFYQTGTIQYYGYTSAGQTVAMSMSPPTTMRAAPTITPSFTNSNITGPGMSSMGTSGAVNIFGSATALGATQLSATFTASADL